MRKFQNGIVGSTNIVEGMVIKENPYPQIVNYLSMYEGGDTILLPSALRYRTYNQTSANCSHSATFSPLKITARYSSEYGYVTTSAYDLTDYVSIHERVSEINCSYFSENDGVMRSGVRGWFGWLDKSISNGTSTTESSFEKTGGGGHASCRLEHPIGDSSNIIAYYTDKTDITSITGNKYLYISNRSPYNANTTAGYVVFTYAVVAKADDWQTLASKAGVTATSLEEVISNAQVVLSKRDAVQFMTAQCTGNFMFTALANENFLTALNNSPHKTIIQSNEHWAKFLALIA